MAAAREGPAAIRLDDELGAIAIMLDFVEPPVSLRRRRDEGRQHRRDKAQAPISYFVWLC